MFETADEKTQQLKVGIFVLCGVLWVFLSGFRWLVGFFLFVFCLVGCFLFCWGLFVFFWGFFLVIFLLCV